MGYETSLSPVYDPKNQPQYQLAILITGCDTGFGYELAILAATKYKYVVFAGCYDLKTMNEKFGTIPNILPFHLDVTNETSVQNSYTIVQNWVQEKKINNNNNQEIGQQRILHALINNAGIGTLGEIDWCTLQDFQSQMDGTFKQKSEN